MVLAGWHMKPQSTQHACFRPHEHLHPSRPGYWQPSPSSVNETGAEHLLQAFSCTVVIDVLQSCVRQDLAIIDSRSFFSQHQNRLDWHIMEDKGKSSLGAFGRHGSRNQWDVVVCFSLRTGAKIPACGPRSLNCQRTWISARLTDFQ